MTLDELDKDMAIAAVLAFKASSPDRRLAGAEWLQQLAGQLVETLKAEQPQPEQPAEETPNPGDGWRILNEGEIIEKGDEFIFGKVNEWIPVLTAAVGNTLYDYNVGRFRRRIQPEPEKARYFRQAKTIWRANPDGSTDCKSESVKGWFSAASTLEVLTSTNTPEITREEAIRIGGEP